MEKVTEGAEAQSHTNYKILDTEYYKEMITHREGVNPTETIERGDSDGMRAKYVQNTERLLDKIRHGFSGEPDVAHESADVVFFLDKSARPVGWLVDAFWDVFPEEGHETKPAVNFMNLHAQEGPGGARPDRQEVDESVRNGEYDSYIQAMQEVYPDMNGKNIMVVDEVTVSGSTEELAYQVFRRAFPGAHIKSAAWMNAGSRQDRAGNSFPVEIPVWYKKNSSSGRGVENIRPEVSAQSASATQRAGAEILSTRPDVPDLEAAQLRREIRQMAQDVLQGRQSVIPERDLDDPRYEHLKIRSAQASTERRSLFQ
jgi:hypothetical protein